MSFRIAIFNHKGGTGKTISAYSLAWKLTQSDGNPKVLLVDGDSQVNLTALCLGVEDFFEYYENSETCNNNIKDGLAPVFEGRPEPIRGFVCPSSKNNERLYILPGHPNLSSFEGQLSLAQETRGNIPALRNIPGAINKFIELIEELHDISYTIIDMNPGLGAINQNFIISSDYIVIPVNPDPFSKMALQTLKDQLISWASWKMENLKVFSSSEYMLRSGLSRFIGVLHSRFNVRSDRAARRFEEKMDDIDCVLTEEFVPSLRNHGLAFDDDCYNVISSYNDDLPIPNSCPYSLARIPDFQSLIHVSYGVSKPIFELSSDDLALYDIQGVVRDNALENIRSFNLSYDAVKMKIIKIVNEC